MWQYRYSSWHANENYQHPKQIIKEQVFNYSNYKLTKQGGKWGETALVAGT